MFWLYIIFVFFEINNQFYFYFFQYAAFGGTLFSGLLAVFLPNQIPSQKQEITLLEGNQVKIYSAS
jgi:hypothetical protein